ncbi:VOC family protein [Hansschlegelia zhihuaiae]|uniref:VOC family protein n=1 Tax=Hansschlegelia zhihuaiae TaxID=405005 RepID=A0A4Q0MNM0_9HYPH|nr:VOC family protein [Hansschlegelia zhihuaiae]RXF74636.1 VOC family protein [Hansschlegelia zhihuaiae]
MSKISPCLWFVDDAEEAANFYVSLLPGSRIDHIARSPSDYPGGKQGSVLLVQFTLAGQTFQALNAGSKVDYTDALSLSLECEDQAEVDRVWAKILESGGREIQCGWIHDRWGVRWQIVPRAMIEMLNSSDSAAAKRAFEAMMDMMKLDVATLKAAFAGKAAA